MNRVYKPKQKNSSTSIMLKIIYSLATVAILAFYSFTSTNRELDTLAEKYIEMYKDLAVIEMHRSGIPASITLAQGLHESDYGKSKLATIANNHFGIKCKSYWNGKTYFYKDDDFDKNGNLIPSCFRQYDMVLLSYVDHTNFLLEGKHYQSLFDYDHTDYESWAHGLKRCGYATDPDYAAKLIKKVEQYDLSRYDHLPNPR
jgi:flagellum-specific peptidoglycan hydrolase FlgJ